MKKLILPLLLTMTCICIDAFCEQDPESQHRENRSDDPMYMLTYDHGGLILWGTDHFEERLDNAIAWLDKYPGFKIGLDNEGYVYDFLAENQPDLIHKIQHYLKAYEGRFGIGSCTYGQPLSTFIGGESNIRQIGYALEANEKYFGYRNTIYLMSEHAMHAQIPQILKGFGFEGAIMRTHYMMYGYNPTYNEPIGWWVGMDGSRIKTVPTYEGEGAAFGRTTVDNWILTRYPSSDAQFSLSDYRKQFQNINPLLATRADDSDLRKEGLVDEYKDNASFQWILLEELLSLYAEPSAEFRTAPNDFTVRMPWGYCGNEIWNVSRKAEVQLLSTERLAALGYLLSGKDYEKSLDTSWKHLLLAQHHDVQIVGLLPDARNHLGISLKESEMVQEQVLNDLSMMVNGAGSQNVVVFNPLMSSERQWIQTRARFKRGEAKDVAVYCGEEKVPATILMADRFSSGHIMECEIAFLADIEYNGIKCYTILPLPEADPYYASEIVVDHENLTVKTKVYDLELSENGGIKSLKNILTGENIFKAGTRNAYLSGLIDGVECESNGRWTISKANSAMPWVVATEYGFIADIPYELQMKIDEDSPQIDWKITVKLDSQRIGQLSENTRDSSSPFIHEKKLRFKFYPNMDQTAKGIRDLPFVLAETDDKYIQGNYWTGIQDTERGIAVFNKGSMCLVRESNGGMSVPLIYAMYYIWGTRMLKGEFQFELAIQPYQGSFQEAEIHQKALSYNFPFVYKTGGPQEGNLDKELKVLDISSDKVILSALYMDKGKVISRLFNSVGSPTTCEITNMYNSKGLLETDLNGNKIGTVNGKLSFDPWQFRTFEFIR